MTPTSCAPPPEHRPAERDGSSSDAHRLVGGHARLLRDVARRAAPVVVLLDARVWPHAELGTLTRYVRTAVLRQVSDEEVLLYPPDPSAPPFAELTAEHVRLHTLQARLEAALAEPCGLPDLRALVQDLLSTLEDHLLAEQEVLAALPDSDGAGDDPVLIRLDALPPERATEMCIERLLRLRRGQTAEVHAQDGLRVAEVGRWMRRFDSAGYGLSYSTGSQEDALLAVSRRPER